ncbi:adenosylhomocysteinase [Kaistia granuli]|uniref:adenosylhomocysteinase n=1 Tax=Kaistia granuli TaxID=363259 RepID=UPI000381340A|nr:adenosylhomocysteinase [Kaistia granuli]
MTTATLVESDLVERGGKRIDWIRSRMRLLAGVRADFEREKPFAGLTIGVSLHLEPKTAVLLETLQAGGADIVGTGNHGSTQDDIVAVLKAQGMRLYGKRDDDLTQHLKNVRSVVAAKPDILLDNGADLAALAIEAGTEGSIRGGTEETTSGGDRLRDELAGKVPFPVIVINDSPLKQIAENRHAVGQSIVESFMRITNLMIPGRRFVVVGYGWCGRGIAQYLDALGGRVAVVEKDPIKALEAALDGYRGGTIDQLAPWGEVFITATGRPGVIGAAAIAKMRSGAILANSGHFPWEIDVAALRQTAVGSALVDDSLERIELADGRHVVLVADGRMFNLAGREPKGNSIESMDIGFMLQALSLARVAGAGRAALVPGAQPVPADINETIARRMVAEMTVDL